TRGSSSVSFPLTVKYKSPFADTDGHWAEKYILDLYRQGILTGVETGGKLYANPDKGVTRAEFAVLLARYIGIDAAQYASAEAPFPDLGPVESWAGGAIRAMHSMGIVNGTERGGRIVFDPGGTLTRAGAVTMLGRLLAQLEKSEPAARMDLSRFADADTIPDYAQEYFEILTAADAIDAVDGGKLAPYDTMTRAVICKALVILKESF
ncbi:MAG: S-layer homology domain-containing protein, partial [Oscillospiraceae bacterium]|nr:S-layer homology domain-containing protein [Oscillospiraceae bacterium]